MQPKLINCTLFLIQVGISVILFIFYNCYGQVINIRERRYARSREVAVKSIRDNVQAQARWQAAKDAIKKRTIEASRSFSRRSTILPSEQVRIFNQKEVVELDYNLHQYMFA